MYLPSLVLGVSLALVNARYPNATATAAPSQCCFVVQDSMSVNYWAHYYTSTWYGLRKVTSVVSTVTQYADTAVTNYETKTTVKNSTISRTFEVAENWVFASNANPGPTLTTKMISASTTTINDRVVTSPAGFFVYPSVKIINVPAVTQANGELACTTRSTYHLNCSGPYESATFTGINSNAEDYFGGLSSSTGTTTESYTVSQWSYLPGTKASQVQITNQSTIVDTRTETITNATYAVTKASATEIVFSTPFLYFPVRGETEVFLTAGLPDLVGYSTSAAPVIARAEPTTSSQYFDPIIADYGYVPQIAIDWMLENPDYVEQYPALASCHPGGPSILPIPDHYEDITILQDGCAAIAPALMDPVGDLTTSSGTTVQGIGCFHPGNCVATPTSAPKSTVVVAVPGSTESQSTASRQPATSVSAEQELPTKTSETQPNPISILAPFLGPSSTDGSATQAYNPAETAKPATNPGVDQVTAGSESISLSPSVDLPVIVIASPTTDMGSSGSNNVITTAGRTISLIPSASAVEVLGYTLAPGSSAVTVSGTVISLDLSGLVIGTSTVPIPALNKDTAAAQTTQGIGGLIIGAFGSHETTTEIGSTAKSHSAASGNATSPLIFLGGTGKDDVGLAKTVIMLGIVAAWQLIS